MDKTEAFRVLGTEDFELCRDVYEEKLHELKLFFLRWVPFTKVYLSKKKFIRRFEEAINTIDGEFDFNQVDLVLQQNETKDVKDFWNCFQSERQRIKSGIMKSESLTELLEYSRLDLLLYRVYANKWNDVNVDEETTASKEFDPMEIHSAILDLNEMISFDELNVQKDLPDMLLKEMKRLTLWRKLEAK